MARRTIRGYTGERTLDTIVAGDSAMYEIVEFPGTGTLEIRSVEDHDNSFVFMRSAAHVLGRTLLDVKIPE